MRAVSARGRAVRHLTRPLEVTGTFAVRAAGEWRTQRDPPGRARAGLDFRLRLADLARGVPPRRTAAGPHRGLVAPLLAGLHGSSRRPGRARARRDPDPRARGALRGSRLP